MTDFATLAELNAHYQPRLFPAPGSEPPPRLVRGVPPAPSARSIAKHRKQHRGLLVEPRWRTIAADELRALVAEHGTWRKVAEAIGEGCTEEQIKKRGNRLGVHSALRRAYVSDQRLLEAWDRLGQVRAVARDVGIRNPGGGFGGRIRALLAKREAGL